MIETLNNGLIWFCIGFAFFAMEFLFPGFIFFFFGIGAWVTALLSFFIDISLNAQIIIFIGSSVISVALLRNWLKRKLGAAGVDSKQLEDEFIGKIAKAETPIVPGAGGKVEFKGTSWDAQSDEYVQVGEHVMITETKSILLIVKPLKTI